MKKTLTIVLALVLALSMLASFAFVINPGTGGTVTPDKNPLAITGFFATSNDAILSGARIYAPLTDKTNDAYAKNEIIRFAITMDVLNPLVPANGVDGALHTTNTMTVTSSTVDFSVSRMAGQQALHVPFGSGLVTAIDSKVTNNGGGSPAAYGAVVNGNVMTIKVLTDQLAAPSTSAFSTAPITGTGATNDPYIGAAITLHAPETTAVTEAKASYAFIFTGITKGEITEQGLAKLVTATVAANKFDATPDTDLIKVEKNGRIYYVEKIITQASILHATITTNIAPSHPYYNEPTKVGYRVYLVGSQTSTTTYELLPVGQFDTESITWKNVGVDLSNTEVEGLGYSLGLEKLVPSAGTSVTLVNGKLPDAVATAAPTTDNYRVFRTVLSNGTVNYILGDAIGTGTNEKVGDNAFTTAEKARLDTMMADFGFSTADNYNYKLEDKYFTTAGTDTDVLTATYNNGTVVPVEPEEEDDLDEPTPDEDLDDDIDEDIDEDLDEDEDVIDDEDEVPAETGDFASDIALALTAAAIVAAAALAFVMKKARD